jgi:hypothetical protein
MANDNIFSYINAISYKKELKYDKTLAPAYLLMLWFSHDKNVLPILNRINHYIFNLPDEIVYNYLYHAIPSGKRFLKWVKKDKTEKEKKLESELEIYNISKREMMLYNNFIK